MTKEDIIRMAIEAGWDTHHAEFDTRIQTFSALVASAEREACAKVCEEYAIGLERNYSEIIAEKIIARGQE